MTIPQPPSAPREWWTRPRVVLPIVASIVVLVALVTPQTSVGRMGDSRLSSRNSGALGARLLYRLAERLGFKSTPRDEAPVPERRTSRGTTIHAVLAPVIPISPGEAHEYLDAVRGGDGLLLALDKRDALADSLGVSHTTEGGILETRERDAEVCGRHVDLVPPLWPDGLVHLYALRWTRGPPPARRVFGRVVRQDDDGRSHEGDAAAGFLLGEGRVVVVADPDLLRNDVVRRCQWSTDVVAVDILEWLRAGAPAARTALVFDEYHQGFGPQPSTRRAVWRFLVGHPLGRAVLTLGIAGLLLIAAVGRRPLTPVDSEVVERRDPLEQVDALAHAYEQVGATRTITDRLLRGIRSRVEGGHPLTRARSHDAFLSSIEAEAPALSADTALVRRALAETIPPRELTRVGAALRRIEDSLMTHHA